MPVSSQSERQPFGLYLHWPYCQAICPYCDFNVVRLRTVDESAWLRAFTAELEQLFDRVPDRTITSVFFGGGTPSLMSPSLVARLIEAIASRWPLAPELEITLEANPTDAEAQTFRDFAQAGINRLSLGLQSLRDSDLKALGRWHSAAEARTAVEAAKQAFTNVSIDLIYGRPDQSLSGWESELREALDLGPQHLSLYQLTIEPGTAFERRHQRGELVMPADATAADLYQMSQDLCTESGFAGYEISNHAKPGWESAHNLTYWRYGDYAGLGPGAHGRLTVDGRKLATSNIRDVKDWLAALQEGAYSVAQSDDLTGAEQAVESLLMGLRLSEGYDMHRYERLAGKPLSLSAIKRLSDEGLLEMNGTRLTASRQGRVVLDGVLQALLS